MTVRAGDGTGRAAAREPGAAVYVFCLLAHQDPATLDPLDMTQWRFFVLPTRVLDQAIRALGLRGTA